MPIKYQLKLISVTKVLIIINIVVYIISCILSKNINPTSNVLVQLGANYSPYIYYNSEIWRFFTSMFLHANLIHIFANMLSLSMLGEGLEQILGRSKFLVLYLVSGIVGSLFSYLISAQIIFNNPTVSLSIGASGAIFGLLGFMLSQKMIERTNVLKGRIKRYLNINFNSVITTIALNLIIGFTVLGIGNAAHIGGLVAGFILGLII